MTPEELSIKFEDCARLSLEPAAIKAATRALQEIETLAAISDLTAKLSGRKRAA